MSDYLTTAQAAARLGIADATVRQAILAGRLHAERWGRDWRIPAANVEAYARDRRPRPSPKAASDPRLGRAVN